MQAIVENALVYLRAMAQSEGCEGFAAMKIVFKRNIIGRIATDHEALPYRPQNTVMIPITTRLTM
jgi:hypothetical protein